MKAREIMTADPTTCSREDDLTAVVEIMKSENCGIVPITEGNGDQKVVGVVTDRDVALYLGKKNVRPSDARASEVMTTDIVSVGPDGDVHDVSRKMQQSQVRRVLVTDGKRLLGVVSTADLARASSRSSTDKVGEEVERVMEKVSEDTGSRPRS
ncbi:MAG TPA: CBS domain-containing protein [Thermoanaerobaculia bacterium]|nr:CBS domain-containing protein [Thermoanaerobaculia bacterium]